MIPPYEEIKSLLERGLPPSYTGKNSFGFRLKFAVHPRKQILIEEESINIQSGEESIRLCSFSKIPIKDSRLFVIIGSGYLTEEKARAAGESMKSAILLTSIHQKMAVYIGPDEVNTVFGDEYKLRLEKDLNIQLLMDINGLSTYKEDPFPQVLSASMELLVGVHKDNFLKTFHESSAKSCKCGGKLLVGIDLLNASQRDASPRSKLVTLISVFESQVSRSSQPIQILKAIDSLLRRIEEEILSEEESRILKNGLSNLRSESVYKGCLDLVSKFLTEAEIGTFKTAYSLRNKLLHEGQSRENEVKGTLDKLDAIAVKLIEYRIENSETSAL